MTRLLPYLLMLGLGLCAPAPIRAHVILLHPLGGESFLPGQVVEISWKLEVPHDQENWDLYFSSDGGITWSVIALDIPLAQRAYQWTIPDSTTVEAKVRIIQDNVGADYVDQSANFFIQIDSTPVVHHGSLPEAIYLLGSYPNPFHSFATLGYDLPRPAKVRLEIYDIAGKLITTLVDHTQEPGRHEVIWKPVQQGRGIYFCRLQVNDHVEHQAMLYISP